MDAKGRGNSYLASMTRAIVVALSILPLLAGCTATPASLGLTGRGLATPPQQPSDADLGVPGLYENSGGLYGPSLVPNTGGGRYFGAD